MIKNCLDALTGIEGCTRICTKASSDKRELQKCLAQPSASQFDEKKIQILPM